MNNTKENISLLFVVDKRYNDVTAVCPTSNLCYSHIGQHSSYTRDWVVDCCRVARRGEYETLLAELKYQVGYDVNVLNGISDIKQLFQS